jgi:hypothetical protein
LSSALWRRPGARTPRRVLVVLLSVFGLVVCGGLAVAATDSDMPDDPAHPQAPVFAETPAGRATEQLAAEIARRSHQQRVQRAAPAERAQRAESRWRYARLSRAEVKTMLKSRYAQNAVAPPHSPLKGRALERIDGPTRAVVRVGDERRLMIATTPLAVPSETAGLKPLDLTLQAAEDGDFEPAAAAGLLRIPRVLDEGIRIGQGGLELRAGRPGARTAGEIVEGGVLYVNSDTDTDTVVRPRPAGLEVFDVLRSENSPEDLRFELAGLDDARLRRNDDGSFEIMVGDQARGAIGRPMASDADGEPVALEATAEGGALRVRVAHRGRDVAYPILVDPILEWYPWQQTGTGMYDNISWEQSGSDNARWPHTWGNFAYLGNGLYSWKNCCFDHFYSHAEAAYFRWWPIGDTRITRAGGAFMDQDLLPGDRDKTCMMIGLMRTYAWTWQNQWMTCHDEDFNRNWYYSVPSSETGPNSLLFGTYMNGSFVRGQFADNVGHIELDIADEKAPTLSSTTSDQWKKTDDVQVVASDSGLGVKQVKFTGADGVSRERWSSGCRVVSSGGTCPRSTPSIGANVGAQGERQITWRAHDPITYGDDTRAGTLTRTVRIDSSPPEIQLTGDALNLHQDTTGRDRFPLSIVTKDGVPGGAPSARRVGVDFVRIFSRPAGTTSWTERARFTQEGECPFTDSCGLDRTWVLDTDRFSEGEHELRVEATDKLGQVATRDWKITIPRDAYYGRELDAWAADVQRRVDAANPLPLSRPMPAPPRHWQTVAQCESGEAELRSCFDANARWGEDLDRWLDANPMLAESPSTLPEPPVYEYARARTAANLTRTMQAVFKAVQRSATDPLAVVRVAIGFHDPRTRAQTTATFSLLDSQSGVVVRGIHDPAGAAVTAGYRSALPQPLTGHLGAFYNSQLSQNATDVAELEQELRNEVDGDSPEEGEAEAIQEALEGERGLRTTLENDLPFIKGIAIDIPLAELLSALTATDTPIKEFRMLPASTAGVEALDGMPTNAETVASTRSRQGTAASSLDAPVRTLAAATDASRYPTCDQVGDPGTDSKDPTFWAPRRISAKVGLWGPPREDGLYRKRASMGLRWTGLGLAWFCGDDPDNRAFEPETKQQETSGKRWGTDQENEGWKTNMPEPYLDDLNGGIKSGFQKDEFPDFAVGTGNGRALRYNRLYYTRNIINYGEANEGNVVVRVQQNTQASGFGEQTYCNGKGQRRDSHCFFRERTCLVAVQPLRVARPIRYRPIWPNVAKDKCFD